MSPIVTERDLGGRKPFSLGCTTTTLGRPMAMWGQSPVLASLCVEDLFSGGRPGAVLLSHVDVQVLQGAGSPGSR
jgi:hypothetical protein